MSPENMIFLLIVNTKFSRKTYWHSRKYEIYCSRIKKLINSIPHPRRKGKQKRRSVGRVEGSGEGLFTSCYSMTAGERTASQPEEPDTEPEPESDMDLMAAAYREGVSEA